MVETRGKPIKCRYCEKTFKISNKEEKKQWQETFCICPLCGEEWCILPPTERKLKYLQSRYLRTKKESDLTSFLKLYYFYIQSLIKKNYSKALKFEGALDYYANETLALFTIKFLNTPDFKIESSFAEYIKWKIIEAIYGKNNKPSEHVSLDFEVEEGGSLHGVIADEKKSGIERIEEEADSIYLYHRVINLLDGISHYCNEQEDYIKDLSFYIFLHKGENGFDKFFQSAGRTGKDISLKTLDILRDELKKV